MPRKTNPKIKEQKEYHVFDPTNVKKTVEIEAKPLPKIEDLETIEKQGEIKIKKQRKPREREISTQKKQIKKLKSEKTPAQFIKKSLKKDGYILIITEKPQAADKIAAALSTGYHKKIVNRDRVSYHELDRYNERIVVGCAVGHLFTLSQNVRGADYPIFDISWYQNSEIKKGDFTKKYHDTIKRLVKDAKEIVIATDFDVEGEVIGYNIIRFIASQNDAKRMKFSSLVAKEIEESFDNRHNTIEWGQAIAGETRHFLDWLYGINLSRALMNSIKKTGKFTVMSIGRVQGPTLKLIVEKEKSITNFKPTPYWDIFIKIGNKDDVLELKHNKDITNIKNLDKFKNLKDKDVEVNTKKTQQILTPPVPFDLTTLQTESYRVYGINPSQTLQIAQRLYLDGLISYPRTSSQKFTDIENVRKILDKLKESYAKEISYAKRKNPIDGNKTDPAHPSITPTGIIKDLEGYDQKIYDLIVKRFISCFCEDAEIENKKVEAEINNLKFSEKGLEIIKSAWMDVYPIKMKEKEVKDYEGTYKIKDVRIEEKETQPPKRYTPASIISELEKRNLGTKATRANIIDTLYDRKYIKEKSIKATSLGISLIKTLEKYSNIITDEKLTREIEKDMDQIRNSKKDLIKKQQDTIKKAEEVLTKISEDFKKNELNIGKELISANQKEWEQEKEDNKLLPCPECKTGHLTLKYTPRFRSYFIGCSNYPECKKTFPLPSNSLIKRTEKVCKECNYPMLLRIKQGKKPWIFCFNPDCPTRNPNYKKENTNQDQNENTEDTENTNFEKADNI